MNVTKEDICNFCRVCIKQLKSAKFNIFENSDETEWSCLYKYLEIDITDGLPQYLCGICHRKIEGILKFRESCLESAKKYREVLGQTDHSEISDIKTELNINVEKTEEFSLLIKNNVELPEFEENNEQISQADIEYSSEKIKNESNDDFATQLSVNNAENFIDDILEEIKEEVNVYEPNLDEFNEKRTTKRGRKRKIIVYNSSDEETYNCKKKLKKCRCKVCGRRFLSKDVYEAHMRKHEGLKPYPCSYCERGFSFPEQLKAHINASHTDDAILYSCPMKKCKKSYKMLPSLRKHCRRTHKASYHSIKEGQNEEKTSENSGNEESKEEKESSDDKSSIDDDKKKSKICSLCNRIHKNQKFQEICIKKHAGFKPYICQTCGKSLATKWSLKNHILCLHTEGTTYEQCPFEGCERIFNNRAKLVQHRQNVHMKKRYHSSEQTFVCPDCGKSFNKKPRFQYHLYKHNGNFPFKCERCPKIGFVTRYELEKHKLRHDGIKNFACDSCDYKCITGQELQLHKNRHHIKTEDLEKYSCSYCDFKTITKANVKIHENVVHLGIRKYKCEHCFKCFGKPHQLKSHMMTHTGERPLQCTLCPRRFIQSQALKIHLKAHAKGTVRLKDIDKLST